MTACLLKQLRMRGCDAGCGLGAGQKPGAFLPRYFMVLRLGPQIPDPGDRIIEAYDALGQLFPTRTRIGKLCRYSHVHSR
jgi:hypothetical protein